MNPFLEIAIDKFLFPFLQWHKRAWNRRADIGEGPGRCLRLLYWLLVEHGF